MTLSATSDRAVPLKYIITSHLNPNLSGVARFNRLLAEKLGVPCYGFDHPPDARPDVVLLSVKVRDLNRQELTQAKRFITYLGRHHLPYDLFFHSFDSLDLEYDMLEHCRQVFCGNAEIEHILQGRGLPLVSAWCPMLLNTQKGAIQEGQLNLFAFGMAHKIQVKYYQLLRDFLEENQLDYRLWVSTAFHEKANFGDFDLISHQLSQIFASRIQFMGFLSDEAVSYFLGKAHLFVTFFEKGVRANNTSVYAAMEKGCALLTNRDEYSPHWMQHRHNMLDIHQVTASDFDPTLLRQLGQAAKTAAQQYASWESLTQLISDKLQQL